MGCGTYESPYNCSPFSCLCNSLLNVSVPYDYTSENFCQIPIIRREQINNVISGSCGNDCNWKYDKQFNLLIINGKGLMKEFESEEEIPWNSFKNQIERIQIFDEITTISKNSFKNCINLKTIKLPDSLISIGENAFENCVLLKIIDIYHHYLLL